jgi:MFS family permease
MRGRKTMILKDETPNPAIPALVIKLFLTWICSLLWGGGIFLSVSAFVIAMLAGLLNYFEPPTWNTQTIYLLIAGLSATFLSLLFLGTFFSRSWRKGFTGGLFALLISTVGFFLFYPLAGFLYDTFSDHGDVFYFFLGALPAALAIITILFWNRFPHSYLGIALGLIIGLGVTLLDAMILGQNLLVSNNIFHLFWQVPPLIWVSIVCYSEVNATRNKRAEILIWFLFMLITFSLPFLIVPLFSLQ